MSLAKNHRYVFGVRAAFSGVAVALLLAGCNAIHVDSQVSESPITLNHEVENRSYGESDFNAGHVAEISTHYQRYGDGPLHVSVAYDPSSSTNTAMRATDKLAEITSLFARYQVNNIKSDILPVRDVGDKAQVFINYDIVTASAPDGCELMGGMEDRPVDHYEGYRYGCGVTTQIARQIYRPQDLNGNATRAEGREGRRSANTTLSYQYGVPNEALEGESVTGD